MTTEPTSDGTSATQVPSPGATPITASSAGATPQTKPTLTVEELLKLNAELEHSHKNAREQADRQAKQLEKYQKQEKEAAAAKEAADLAQLSEIERTKKQHAELQSQYEALVKDLQQERVNRAVEQQAAKLNFKYPEVAVKLLDWAELEYDEGGKPKNVDKLLEKIALAMPDLVRTEQASTSPAQTAPTPNAPAIPAMNHGRSNIAAPGSNPPGRIPSWSDIYKRP
jgi:hypothetical protein